MARCSSCWSPATFAPPSMASRHRRRRSRKIRWASPASTWMCRRSTSSSGSTSRRYSRKSASPPRTARNPKPPAQFLQKLLALAESAGGNAPRPEAPDTQDVRALQMLSGNAQLLKIHEQKDDLTAKLAAWKKNADAIAKRWPAWERLLDFHNFATGLPEAEVCAKSIAAITDGRTLLADPGSRART